MGGDCGHVARSSLECYDRSTPMRIGRRLAYMTRWTLVAAVVLSTAGCGLIDSDITNFELLFPDKEFTVDTAQWELSDDATFPEIPCDTQPGVCSTGIAAACGNEALCFGSCDGVNCKATVLVALFQPVNLYDERPELKTIDEQPLVSVTVDRVAYDVTENTLSMDSPELTLYVGPATAMTPGDPLARPVGTVAPIPAGTQPTEEEVNMTPEGRDDLREFMKDYMTEFNIIVGAQVEIEAGDPMPSGRLTAKVYGNAHAGL